MMEHLGFYNIFLIRPSGDVIFSVAKDSRLHDEHGYRPL
ncbi:hypothetical protein METH_14535 [Leisingera methylohalidivorans DSM 14336]|uniref:Uncharacterized protein n=1 Tax=Leisingera methylohalidivorans DSM 14336 TaxID=999552 RepID=V9VYX1_9RHOB|nr:hypothetical protein METH_14535 [Leisingera methylohalidivorans DSM 14336]